MDPADVTYMVSKLDSRNFDLSTTDTAAPVIKPDSRLGHYILYCGQRQSPFGLADQNIANDFRTLTTHSTIGDTVISAIPVVGSLVDVYNEARVIANFGYVSGESCVTGNAVAVQETERDDGTTSIETSDWSENKYYQRFIEDQRLAENMGVVEKSSVTAFLEDYYKDHPIDDSYEGVLARRSGLTKDQVIATLDVMEAIAFSQNYNPDGYAPVFSPHNKRQKNNALGKPGGVFAAVLFRTRQNISGTSTRVVFKDRGEGVVMGSILVIFERIGAEYNELKAHRKFTVLIYILHFARIIILISHRRPDALFGTHHNLGRGAKVMLLKTNEHKTAIATLIHMKTIVVVPFGITKSSSE